MRGRDIRRGHWHQPVHQLLGRVLSKHHRLILLLGLRRWFLQWIASPRPNLRHLCCWLLPGYEHVLILCRLSRWNLSAEHWSVARLGALCAHRVCLQGNSRAALVMSGSINRQRGSRSARSARPANSQCPKTVSSAPPVPPATTRARAEQQAVWRAVPALPRRPRSLASPVLSALPATSRKATRAQCARLAVLASTNPPQATAATLCCVVLQCWQVAPVASDVMLASPCPFARPPSVTLATRERLQPSATPASALPVDRAIIRTRWRRPLVCPAQTEHTVRLAREPGSAMHVPAAISPTRLLHFSAPAALPASSSPTKVNWHICILNGILCVVAWCRSHSV